MSDLAFVEIVMTDLSDLPSVNTLFARLFAEDARPARTVSQAAALPYGGKIKVHGVAVGSGRSDPGVTLKRTYERTLGRTLLRTLRRALRAVVSVGVSDTVSVSMSASMSVYCGILNGSL